MNNDFGGQRAVVTCVISVITAFLFWNPVVNYEVARTNHAIQRNATLQRTAAAYRRGRRKGQAGEFEAVGPGLQRQHSFLKRVFEEEEIAFTTFGVIPSILDGVISTWQTHRTQFKAVRSGATGEGMEYWNPEGSGLGVQGGNNRKGLERYLLFNGPVSSESSVDIAHLALENAALLAFTLGRTLVFPQSRSTVDWGALVDLPSLRKLVPVMTFDDILPRVMTLGEFQPDHLFSLQSRQSHNDFSCAQGDLKCVQRELLRVRSQDVNWDGNLHCLSFPHFPGPGTRTELLFEAFCGNRTPIPPRAVMEAQRQRLLHISVVQKVPYYAWIWWAHPDDNNLHRIALRDHLRPDVRAVKWAKEVKGPTGEIIPEAFIAVTIPSAPTNMTRVNEVVNETILAVKAHMKAGEAVLLIESEEVRNGEENEQLMPNVLSIKLGEEVTVYRSRDLKSAEAEASAATTLTGSPTTTIRAMGIRLLAARARIFIGARGCAMSAHIVRLRGYMKDILDKETRYFPNGVAETRRKGPFTFVEVKASNGSSVTFDSMEDVFKGGLGWTWVWNGTGREWPERWEGL